MTEQRERLLSLDVFRGLTVASMLLVNDPGTWSAIYPPLEHAPWNGWTDRRHSGEQLGQQRQQGYREHAERARIKLPGRHLP